MNLRNFLGKFQKINVELRDIKQNFKDLGFHLSSREGKLNGFEFCGGQLQGKIHIVKHKVAAIEENSAVVDITLEELNENTEEIYEDLDILGKMVDNLDNLQRNNIKVRGFKENIEGEYLVQFLVALFSG